MNIFQVSNAKSGLLTEKHKSHKCNIKSWRHFSLSIWHCRNASLLNKGSQNIAVDKGCVPFTGAYDSRRRDERDTGEW